MVAVNFSLLNPLPVSEDKKMRVFVYIHSNNEWIPVTFCNLDDAIALHRRGQHLGVDFLAFPVDSQI